MSFFIHGVFWFFVGVGFCNKIAAVRLLPVGARRTKKAIPTHQKIWLDQKEN